ncbi:MAG TPA: peptidylprolyl isomerase [Thermoanaerobaculia bacterium]|nr:peptidylprolyl isomerase [Thermoanaerobaculia bacterium]
MKRPAVAFLLVLTLALPLAAQQQAAPKSEPKVVATVNGEVITQERLDQLYNRMNPQMRAQYDQQGGKAAFLETYLRKRLIVQEALKAGFDKRSDVQIDIEAAKETAIFERYIRDVIAADVVSEAEVRKFYDDNARNYATPEKIKAWHIIVMFDGAGPRPKTKAQAAELIQKVANELREKVAGVQTSDATAKARIALSYFGEAAQRYSEDGAAKNGGDLGWVPRGAFDAKFEEIAYSLPVGTISDVFETRFGYHIVYVEGKQPAGQTPYEQVRSTIRDHLLSQKMPNVMEEVTRLANELRTKSNIGLFPENIR